jgi:hypothetical protein
MSSKTISFSVLAENMDVAKAQSESADKINKIVMKTFLTSLEIAAVYKCIKTNTSFGDAKELFLYAESAKFVLHCLESRKKRKFIEQTDNEIGELFNAENTKPTTNDFSETEYGKNADWWKQ